MKKTYWWRLVATLISVGMLIIGEITFYPYKYGLCNSGIDTCFFNSLRKSFSEPLFIFSIALILVSSFLFFVKDSVFIKWLKFSFFGIIISWFFILITPVSVYSFSPLTIEREIVSIWMSSLFLIVSIVMITIWSIKDKKSKK